MMILYKIFGVILFLIGISLGLSILMNLSSIILAIGKIFSSQASGFQRGESMGTLVTNAIIITLAFFCFKFGAKFFRSK